MKKITFAQLPDTDICISEITCIEYQWKGKRENEYRCGRDQNVLSFNLNGKKQLFSPNRDDLLFDVSGASVFFISKNTPYTSKSFAHDEQTLGYTACIKFRLADKNGEDILLSDKYLCWDNINEEFFEHLFKKVMNAYMIAKSNNFAVKNALYKLLDELFKALRIEGKADDSFEDLLPAMRYLETNLSSNASVDELAKMCFMSNSYFYKRFKEYTGGICITDYRNKMRIEKAKELLESPLWTTALIAETLGFYDISHFYRVYKKYTGETPKISKKQHEMGVKL